MTTLDILWVAPQAGDLPRSLQALVAAGECRVRQAVGGAAGVAAWQANRPDLVLLTLADGADLDLLAAVAADVPDPWPGEPLRLPVVVVVAAQPESLAAQALHQGATGYLVQGQITPLALRQALHQGVAYQRLAQRCCQAQRQVDTLAQQHHQDAARWEFLVQTSPAVIYSTEPTANYACTFVSDRLTQVLGYSPAEVYAQPDFWVSHLHPDDAPQVFADHDHLFEQGWLSHEYRLRHRQGHDIWVQDELRLVRDQAGKPLEIVGYFTEISDRKHQEKEKATTAAATQALSDRLTLALQAGAFGTWDWDLQQEAVWDQRIYEIYGLQNLGRSATYTDWRACVHPEDIAAAEAQIQAAIA
ncbi:MAG: PAS domain-containing protein, partial [Leptolyngbya sp.]|nr:PAS domain-containing protein [Leptolyngbya sp.]